MLRFDDIVIDPDGMKVTRGGEAVELEPKSFRVLLYLAQNAGRVVKKDELLQAEWNGTFVTDNALTRVIAQLRKALGDDARQPRYIETIPTEGYRFVARPAAEPAPPPAAAVEAPWWRRLLVPAGAIFAITMVFFFRAFTPPEAVEIPSLRSIQVTSGGGLDAHPSFSPDGTSITYSSDRTGKFEIYARLAETGGGRDIAVTNDGNENVQPVWSPDGKMIAYHSLRLNGISVAPSLGGTPRRITEFGSQPAWSPESRRIVFRSERTSTMAVQEVVPTGMSTIWMVSPYGGEPQPLTKRNEPEGRHSDPVFSPDGKQVLFVSHRSVTPGVALWEMDVATRQLRQFETGVAHCYSPHYTPDGTGIFYFGGSQPNDIGLWALGIDKYSRTPTRKPQRLMQFDFVTPRDLAIGPETKRLAYTATTTSSHLWKWTPGGDDKALTAQSSDRMTFPVFSPDGRKLAYAVRNRGALADVWVSGADGSNPVQITNSPGPDHMASWRRDSQTVLYGSLREGKPELWEYTLSTGKERRVAGFRDRKVMARLSPDEKWLIYHSGPEGALNIWKMDLATGNETQLTRDTESAGYPVWSADGKQVAFELFRNGDTHLAVVSSEGGPVRQVTDRPGHAWPFSWLADGRIAIAGRWDGMWNLYAVDVSTGNAKVLTRNNLTRVFVRYPSWAPDGKSIVYERNETKGNLFVAEPAGAVGSEKR